MAGATPRYFFHVRGGPVEAGRLPLDERIDVNDASGRPLLSLSFGEAVAAPR